MKRFLLATSIILTVIGFSVFSCAAQKKSLVMWCHSAVETVEAYRTLMKQFSAIHPDVEFDLRVLPWGDYAPKLIAAFTANQEPDLLAAHQPWLTLYTKTGTLSPVPSWVATPKELEEKYFEPTLKFLQYKDKYYGIPLNMSADTAPVLLVNTDLLSEAGIVPPFDTLEELMQAWQKLTVFENGEMVRAGLGYFSKAYMLDGLIMQAGNSVVSEDKRKATLETSAVRKSLQFLRDLVNKYKVASPKVGVSSAGIGKGTAATEFVGVWYTHPLVDSFPELNWKYVRIPALMKGAKIPYWHGGVGFGWFVTKKCEYQKTAWEFVKFLSSDQSTMLYLGLSPELPASKELCFSPRIRENPIYEPWIQVLDYARFDWPIYSEPGTILGKMVDDAMGTELSLEDIQARGQSQLQRALDLYWRKMEALGL